MAIIGVSVFGTVFLLLYLSVRVLSGSRMKMSARVNALLADSMTITEVVRPTGRRRSTRRSRTVPQSGFLGRLDSMLKRAEISLAPRDFLARWFVIVVCLMAIATLLLHTGGAILVLVVSIMATYIYFRLRGNRRRSRFDSGLIDMMTMLVNSLRAGFSLLQAFSVLRDDLDGPIQEEMDRILGETQVGVTLEEALDRSAARVESADFDLIVTAINIQRMVGGNLAQVLDQISGTIRERVHLKSEIRALTAQGRMAMVIFMLLPMGLAVIMVLLSPTYMAVMVQTLIGKVLIVGGLLLQFIGYIFIRRIIRVEM